MKIKYSPSARKKACSDENYIGIEKVRKITKAINDLKTNPLKCPSVERILGISSKYYFCI